MPGFEPATSGLQSRESRKTAENDRRREREVVAWEGERQRAKLLALACKFIDDSPRTYTSDPRYQRVTKMRADLDNLRAELDQRQAQLRP